MTTQQAYPLNWPKAWKRTAVPTWSKFGERSLDRCVQQVLNELRRLGASNAVISTNIRLRSDGLPRGDQPRPKDCGVAVYFTLNARPCVLAVDKWRTVEENLWAIANDIEAQRGRLRWGVGSVEQAFAGYTALPGPGESGAAVWYSVLQCAHDAPFHIVKEAYLARAKAAHPDNGGSHDSMVLINQAWDMARAAFQK